MLAVVTQNSGSIWQSFTLSWFDLILCALLAFSIWRGRRRGLTKEMSPFLLWITILLACTFGHPPLADIYEQQGLVSKVFGHYFQVHTAALMSAYLTILVAVFIFFLFFKRRLQRKLEGSNAFGGFEYYGGTIAGLLRYISIVFVVLALLHAPVYSEADIAADKAYKNRWFGGGLKEYNGNFIPSIYEIQDSVFKGSYSGAFIKDYLSIMLINSGAPHGH